MGATAHWELHDIAEQESDQCRERHGGDQGALSSPTEPGSSEVSSKEMTLALFIIYLFIYSQQSCNCTQ